MYKNGDGNWVNLAIKMEEYTHQIAIQLQGSRGWPFRTNKPVGPRKKRNALNEGAVTIKDGISSLNGYLVINPYGYPLTIDISILMVSINGY